MFCKVERSYIEDGFNLYGLRQYVQNFSDCLDLILDRIGPDDSDDSHLTQSACTLYGMIHARYIITAHGLDAMYNKYANKEFGTCPLIQCYGQPVLPVGLHDEIGLDHCKLFCPKCQNVYHPNPYQRIRGSSSSHHGPGHASSSSREHQVDGSSFGTTFAHLFLMTFHNLVPDRPTQESKYVPRVFGFRVHNTAKSRITNGNGSGSGSNSNSANSASGNNNAAAATNGAKDGASNVAASLASTASAAGATSTNGAVKPAPGQTLDESQLSAKGKKGKPRKSKLEDAGKRRPKNLNFGNGNGGDEGSSKKRQKRPYP